MAQATDSSVSKVCAFYLQPDQIRFPFRLPDPARKGIRLKKSWVYLVSLETLERMGGGNDTIFLCNFPVTVLLQGGDFAQLKRAKRLRIGQARAKVTITGNICGDLSHGCGFAENCLLKNEAILAEVVEEGLVQNGDFVFPSERNEK